MYGEENPDENKPILPEVRIFWIFVATFLVVGILAVLLRDHPNRWVYLQTVILALTLLVVAWYTYLTNKMQEAMVNQINVSILPIIEVYVELMGFETNDGVQYRANTRSFVGLENIGQAAALNIEIDPIVIKDSTAAGITTMDGDPLWFSKISSVSPKEKKQINHIQVYDKRNYGQMLGTPRPEILQYLHPEKAVRDYKIIIRFSDVLGNRYAQIYNLGKSGNFSEGIRNDNEVGKTTINIDHKEVINFLEIEKNF